MKDPEIVNDWEPEVRSLLATLERHNLTVLYVDNGDEEGPLQRADTTLAAFVAEATACDETRLFVRTPEGKTLGLYLVFGNSPGELVADYHVHPLIDAAATEHAERWEGRKQPTKSVNIG